MLLINKVENNRTRLSAKKTRHIVEIFNYFIIVYIDYNSALNIIKQTTLTTFFTNKLNFRLVRASNYIQQFNLKIRHKLKKQHIIFDVFFRLISDNINSFNYNEKKFDVLFITNNNEKLNALFTILLVEIKDNFCKKILNNYKLNFN